MEYSKIFLNTFRIYQSNHISGRKRMEKTKRKYSGKIPGRKKRKRTSYTSHPMYMYRGKKENEDIYIIMYKIDPLLGTN